MYYEQGVPELNVNMAIYGLYLKNLLNMSQLINIYFILR